eukprot:5550677-Karenia_brevis.AAC.1
MSTVYGLLRGEDFSFKLGRLLMVSSACFGKATRSRAAHMDMVRSTRMAFSCLRGLELCPRRSFQAGNTWP